MNEKVYAASVPAAVRKNRSKTSHGLLHGVCKLTVIAAISALTIAAMLYLSVWEKMTRKKIFPGF